MYKAFFGFQTDPFAAKPDPAFFFRSSHHDAALKGLLLSVEARMGLVSLVGDEGSGKTVVLECLRNSLGPDIRCAFLRDSRISFDRLLETIASDLDLDLRSEKKSAPDVFFALTRLMTQQARKGSTVVLIVDEADNLSPDVFNDIVHIASLHNNKVKEIQTIFAGRPELQPRLATLNSHKVNQRALLIRSLYPFTARETQEYVEFRMACAGVPKQTIFPREVLEEIHDHSQGLAPAIHALCEKLLLTAFSESSKVCTSEIRDQVFKKPPTKLAKIVEIGRTVGAAQIDPPPLASPPAPEPPPMQTVFLRVSVDARTGSLRPRPVSTDERPIHLGAIDLRMVFPRRRFTLAGAELPLSSTRPMPIADCTKASALSPSLDSGPRILSIPVHQLFPRLPEYAAGDAHKPGARQLSACKLILSESYVRIGAKLSGIPSLTGSFPETLSRALQPRYPATSLQPASVIPCRRVPLTPFHANSAPLPPAMGRLVEMEPANLIPGGLSAAATVLGASLHPSVALSNTLLPLPFSAQPIPAPAEKPIHAFLSAPPSLDARRPVSGLKPADRPLTWTAPSASSEVPWGAPLRRLTGTRRPFISHQKPLLTFVIPILAAMALYGAPPAMRAAADASRQGWQRAQQAVLNRAAVTHDEDFRAGLSNWTNRGGSPTPWKVSPSAFVRPGALALYRPSLGMADYQMQFLGTIDKKSLSWVVRAADFNNYYAVRLVVLKPGPLPAIGVTRYAVIDGIPQKSVTTPLLIRAQADTVYRVRLDVHGDQFALAIQDQLVDSWSEPRLGHGAIGFFSETDAGSRIASLRLRGQYDALGRLCAFLMPFAISSSR